MKVSRFSKTLACTFLFAISFIGLRHLYMSHIPQSAQPISQGQLIVNCKKLSKQESLKQFEKDVLKAGYAPIAININNNSDRYIKFCPTDITLKTASAETVAKKVHNKTFLRTIIWKVGSFFNPLFSLPGTAHTALEDRKNKKIDNKFSQAAAADRLIGPHETLENVIFVANQDYQNDFTILLTDKNANNGIITCTVDLEGHMPVTHSF